jgi:hypothetical protein
MDIKPLLMGAEIEYSMPRTEPTAHRRPPPYHDWMLEAIRSEHPWLPDTRNPSGIYIDNGSRYYLDSGNHNEFCTPELSTPRQVAVYDRAAERILLRAKARVRSGPDGADICITKNNVNFSKPDEASWGQHEAYTCWIPLEQAAPQLIPHLVSRLPFAGAGCLSAHATGMGFELSQRARHMTRPKGVETTHDRAIFCMRAWKPSDKSELGCTRTNLLPKDSHRCSFGMYLTYATTGLLFMIINQGHRIGGELKLKDPVAAMRTFSLDPWLRAKVALANGKQATAIDIQRAYLRETETHIESGDYPEWCSETLDHWSATLDQLESDPLQLADRLDTYLKLTIFDHQLKRESLSWSQLQGALKTLDQMRRTAPESVVSAVLNEDAGNLDREHQALCRKLSKIGALKHVGLDRLRFAVRLQAIELNYHELGGLYDQLEASGHVNPVVVTAAEVEHAIHHPPSGGRAEARSNSIAELQGQPWMCDWEYVVSQTEEKWVDLRDPFSNKREITSSDGKLPRRSRSSAIHDLLSRLATQ